MLEYPELLEGKNIPVIAKKVADDKKKVIVKKTNHKVEEKTTFKTKTPSSKPSQLQEETKEISEMKSMAQRDFDSLSCAGGSTVSKATAKTNKGKTLAEQKKAKASQLTEKPNNIVYDSQTKQVSVLEKNQGKLSKSKEVAEKPNNLRAGSKIESGYQDEGPESTAIVYKNLD